MLPSRYAIIKGRKRRNPHGRPLGLTDRARLKSRLLAKDYDEVDYCGNQADNCRAKRDQLGYREFLFLSLFTFHLFSPPINNIPYLFTKVNRFG